MKKNKTTVDRRTFLSGLAVAGVSGTLGGGSLLSSCSGGGDNEQKLTRLRPASEVYIPELPDKAVDGRPIKAGLIGCGARGSGAAINFLDAANDVSIVACADLFSDRMATFRWRLNEEKKQVIADDKCFLGFDAYKKICDMPDIDLVLIASPELFHPEHAKYAIEQGKHVFCEKPACIDPAGYRTFMMAVKQAQTRNLCFVTGTQRHHHRAYVESYQKIQEGYIGRITSGNVYWNQGCMNFVRRRPEWTDMEYMLRDFYSWNWLCGDHMNNQVVHNVDVFTWFSHLKPVRVIAMGASLRRLTGDVYDNFSADIEYEGGVHVHAMARQIDDCDNRIAEIIQGTNGSWNSIDKEYTILDLNGNVIWKYNEAAANKQFKQHNAYVLEHVNMVNHIRQGKVINVAETTAISSIACMMARESAYTGKMITWDEMIQSNLNFMPDQLTMGNIDMSKYVIPLPGSAPTT